MYARSRIGRDEIKEGFYLAFLVGRKGEGLRGTSGTGWSGVGMNRREGCVSPSGGTLKNTGALGGSSMVLSGRASEITRVAIKNAGALCGGSMVLCRGAIKIRRLR